jgi:hypothetical protein
MKKNLAKDTCITGTKRKNKKAWFQVLIFVAKFHHLVTRKKTGPSISTNDFLRKKMLQIHHISKSSF